MKNKLLPTLLLFITFQLNAQTNSSFGKLQPVIEEYLFTDLDSAEKYALILLEKSTLNKSQLDEHHAYNYLAHVYYRRGEKLEALDYFQQSLKTRKLAGKITEIANTENWIGRIHHETGEFNLGLKFYLQALETLKQNPDSAYILQTLNNVTKLHLDLNNSVKTDEYNLKAIQIGKLINDKIEYANACNLRGIYWQEQAQYDSAKTYYQVALDIYKEENISSRMAQGFNNIGIINFFLGEYDSAYRNFLSSAAIRKSFIDSSYYAQSLRNLGDYHFYMSNLDSSEYYYQTSIRIAKNAAAYPDVSELYQSLSDLYYEKKDFEKAYQHLWLYIEIKEKLMNESLQESLQRTEAKFQFKNQKEQMRLISSNNKKLNNLNAQLVSGQNLKNAIIYALGGVILLLILLLFRKRVSK